MALCRCPPVVHGYQRASITQASRTLLLNRACRSSSGYRSKLNRHFVRYSCTSLHSTLTDLKVKLFESESYRWMIHLWKMASESIENFVSLWSLSKKKVKTVLIWSSFLINFPYRITRVVENRVNPISSYERIPIFSFRYEKFHAFLFNVTVLTFEYFVLNRTRRLRVNIYARNNPDLLLTPRHLRIKINYGLRRRYSFMNARVTNDPLSGAITRRCRRDNDFAG